MFLIRSIVRNLHYSKNHMPPYQHLARVKKVCLERMYYHNRHLQQTHMNIGTKIEEEDTKGRFKLVCRK